MSGYLLGLLVIGFPGAAGAVSNSTAARGTTSAQFLELTPGARSAGMGEAYSAVANEASAVYWNPAALTRVRSCSLTMTHASYIDSSFFDFGAFAQNLGSLGAYGLGFQYFSAGSVDATDATGADIGTLSPFDLALSASYAVGLPGIFEGFSVGGTGKYIESHIAAKAQTGAADVGLLSPSYFGHRLRFALTALNIGGKLRFEQQTEDLPSAMRLGAALRFGENWLAALDATAPKDDQVYAGIGVEHAMRISRNWQGALRAGFNSRTVGSIDGLAGPSIGFGLANRTLVVDYAFVPFGGVGMANRVSLSFRFGGESARERADDAESSR